MPARPFASFPASQSFSKTSFSSPFHALFMGPDLERPKSYQSFLAMGNLRCVWREKRSDLHTSNFSFIISFLSSSPIAQSVERRTVNPQVAGSSPARGAKEFRATHASEWPFWFLLLWFCRARSRGVLCLLPVLIVADLLPEAWRASDLLCNNISFWWVSCG